MVSATALSAYGTTCNSRNLSGLHLGLGVNVSFDKYNADVTVGRTQNNAIKRVTVDKAAAGVTNITEGAGTLVQGLWGYNGTLNEDLQVNGTSVVTKGKDEVSPTYANVTLYDAETGGNTYAVYASEGDQTKISADGIAFYVENVGKDGFDPLESFWQVVEGEAYRTQKTSFTHLYYTTGADEDDDVGDGSKYAATFHIITDPGSEATTASQITVDDNIPATYLLNQALSRRGTSVGGELKLAYFHDFGNNLMAGIDFTGAISPKNKKHVTVGQLNINTVTNPDLTLTGSTNGTIVTATYDTESSKYQTTAESGTITAGETLTLSNKYGLEKLNPTMSISEDNPGVDFIDASNAQDVSFEKSVFNPKLAFVIGGTINGFFAGFRAGMSYTKGTVKTVNMSKGVSIISPFIGAHIMKQINDTTHMYLTADWNISNGRRSIHMNGVKNLKQNGYNISAGITWRVKSGN